MNPSNRRNNDKLLVELRGNLALADELSKRVLGKGKDKKKAKKEAKKEAKKDAEKKKSKDKKKAKKAKKASEAAAAAPSSPSSPSPFFGTFGIPLGIMTDSYKAAHFEMYPEAQKMVAYGEFRMPYKDLKGEEQRFVSYGMRNLIETYLSRPWTEQDVDQARDFYATHNAGNTSFPFPEHLFRKFVRENKGYFPVKIEALREGTVAHIHVPVYQITARGEYSRLVTYLETVLTHIWYPSTVATLSRKCRDILAQAFEKSVERDQHGLLDSRLHDFGFRGCTCLEQAILGGSAHLLSFDGSDTMPASYYVQHHLNGGRPIGTSIPASEHSVMTSFSHEKAAFANMVKLYGSGVFSVVMDSYDYERALNVLAPAFKPELERRGGFMVYRPDSGDPIEAVLQALRAAEAAFGATKNSLGYRVVRGVSVLQGDGIALTELQRILAAVLDAGFSAQSVAFGMGSGLLQKVNRDTMSFATKLSFIRYADGSERDVMKKPKTDSEKISLPGILKVTRNGQGIPTIYPAESAAGTGPNLLETVWDNGPVPGLVWDQYDQVRARTRAEWDKLPAKHDPRSPELMDKIKRWIADFKEMRAEEEKGDTTK